MGCCASLAEGDQFRDVTELIVRVITRCFTGVDGPSDGGREVFPTGIPGLVLVAFLVGRAAQFVRWGLEEEALLGCDMAEDSEFLVEIGSTALKARNCFAAASELCNKCLERDSRRSVAWSMGGH